MQGLTVEDVDGDGRILQMRLPDPHGPWKCHPQDERLMIPREPGEFGGRYYRVMPEGTLLNFDRAFNVPLFLVILLSILAGVGLYSPETLSASLYYTLHSTVVIAGLFLLVELMAAQRGEALDKLRPAAAVREPVLLGLMMIFGAASAAGLPPLPGFLGKLMILESSSGLPAQVWVWAVVLSVGFFTIVGLARAGVIVFWHIQPDEGQGNPGSGSSVKLLSAVWAFMALTLAMAVLASPVKRYTDAATAQLADQAAYARAVLGMTGAPTTRPYDGQRTPAAAPTEETR